MASAARSGVAGLRAKGSPLEAGQKRLDNGRRDLERHRLKGDEPCGHEHSQHHRLDDQSHMAMKQRRRRGERLGGSWLKEPIQHIVASPLTDEKDLLALCERESSHKTWGLQMTRQSRKPFPNRQLA